MAFEPLEVKLVGVLAIGHEWPTLRMTALNFKKSSFPRDSHLRKTCHIFCNCSHVLLLSLVYLISCHLSRRSV
jgi:hypothetical protein